MGVFSCDFKANAFTVAVYPCVMQRASPSWLLYSLLTLNVIFLLCTLWLWPYNPHGIHLFYTCSTKDIEKDAEKLYLEDDYPIELPLSFETVAMTLLRNTTRFQMNLNNHISRLEWTTLSSHPFVFHIGGDGRAFQVALFHQLHCIHVMEEAFLRGEYHGLNSHHIQHCENYLRQSFLCMADDSIEYGDFLNADILADMNMGSKVCRDWSGVSNAVKDNLKKWFEWNRSPSESRILVETNSQ